MGKATYYLLIATYLNIMNLSINCGNCTIGFCLDIGHFFNLDYMPLVAH